MSIKRKFKKLLRDPKQFWSDMLIKHENKRPEFLKRKYKAENKFTVVSAVYNVEKYLNEYFESLTRQSVDFESSIYLILVDDGSTDSSALIINEWVNKYPKNITYLYQRNKGQASARNVGLKSVKTEWVTFIDPDDYVDRLYFENIDKTILREGNSLAMISTNVIYYVESSECFKDTHPLRYRYQKNRVIDVKKLGLNFETSVASCFIKMSCRKDIEFREELKGYFEDADFCVRYLLENREAKVSFLPKAKYFYRKRADESSTLDGAFKDKRFYLETLEIGCLQLLRITIDKHGSIPTFVQNTVLHHILPYFKRYINHRGAPFTLDSEEKNKVFLIFIEIFKLIETKSILSFNINGCHISYRMAFISFFKKSDLPVNNFYVEKYDQFNDEILLSYYCYNPLDCLIEIDGNNVLEKNHKLVKYELFDRPIVYEHRLWIKCHKGHSLRISVKGKKSRIFLDKKKFDSYIDLDVVRRTKSKEYENDIWLMMDRDVQADDNAEHFYRYMMNERPEKECYFAIRKDSHDWSRLKKDGFKLVEFGSAKFEGLLRGASKVISSHSYATNYFGGNSLERDFIFLQHGVIHNDHSMFFNGRSNLSCFITTTKGEYETIALNDSHYKMTTKEVSLTGLPRYDNLLKNNSFDKKVLLIMPTWRRSIVGGAIGGGLQRQKNEFFMETDYAVKWSALLNSSKLREMLVKHGYEVVFAPHAEIEPYLDVFRFPSYIKVWRPADGSIQELFQESLIMLTDYSSVAFDMAFLGKAILYYQFDWDEFYGDHYRQDYFDYFENGFGPIASTQDEILSELNKIFMNQGRPDKYYLERVIDTFPYRDGENCKRVYESIKRLSDTEDSKESENSEAAIMIQINNAKLAGNWRIVKEKCRELLRLKPGLKHKMFAFENLFVSYTKNCDWIGLQNILTRTKINNNIVNRIPILVGQRKWRQAFDALNECSFPTGNEKQFYYLLINAELSNSLFFEKGLIKCSKYSFSYYSQKIFHHLSTRSWKNIINILNDDVVGVLLKNNDYYWLDYNFDLLLVRAYINVNNIKKAQEVLDRYEPKSAFDLHHRVLQAQIMFMQKKYLEVISLLSRIINREGEVFLLESDLKIYVESLLALKRYGELQAYLNSCDKSYRKTDHYLDTKFKVYFLLNKWESVISLYKRKGIIVNSKNNSKWLLYIASSYYCMGNIIGSYGLVIDYDGKDYDLLKLKLTLAWVSKDFKTVEHTLRRLLSEFYDRDHIENLNLYNQFLFLHHNN